MVEVLSEFKKYIDGDDILTLLYEKLKECNLYDGAEIWVDEFTTFTPQQLQIVLLLAKKCKTVNITLCSDNLELSNEDDTDIFDVIKNTENRILKGMEDDNISYLEPINLNKIYPYRFKNSEELKHLERHFFSYPFRNFTGKCNSLATASMIAPFAEPSSFVRATDVSDTASLNIFACCKPF